MGQQLHDLKFDNTEQKILPQTMLLPARDDRPMKSEKMLLERRFAR
jgi:hypothetical protein